MLVAFVFLALFMLESGNVLSNNAVMAPSDSRSYPAIMEMSTIGRADIVEELALAEREKALAPIPVAMEQRAEVCRSRCQANEEPKRRDSVMKLQVKEVMVENPNHQTAH